MTDWYPTDALIWESSLILQSKSDVSVNDVDEICEVVDLVFVEE